MNHSNSLKLKKFTLVGLLAPGIAIYIFITIIPLFTALSYSFTNWMGGPTKEIYRFGELFPAYKG